MTASHDKQGTVAIAVAGDRLVDWGLVGGNAGVTHLDIDWVWQAGAAFQLAPQSLGAETSGELLGRICRDERLDAAEVRLVPPPAGALTDPRFPQVVRTFSLWGPLLGRGRDPQGRAWRIERIIGRAPATAPLEVPEAAAEGTPDIAAFLDLDLGFRDDPPRWRHLLGRKPAPEVFLRTTAPLGSGELWRELCDHHADRLTVVIDAGDLRRASLRVEQPLSWEHIYDHVVAAVAGSPLSAARRVVVTLDLSGAVVIERDVTTTLVFDPHLEAGGSQRARRGIRYRPSAGHARGPGTRQPAQRGHNRRRTTRPRRHARPARPRVRRHRRARPGARELPVRPRRAHHPRRPRRALLREPDERAARHQQHPGRVSSRATSWSAPPARSPTRVPRGSAACRSRPSAPGRRSTAPRSRTCAACAPSWPTTSSPSAPAGASSDRSRWPCSARPGRASRSPSNRSPSSLLPGQLRTLEFNLSQLPGDDGLAAAFHVVRDAVLEQHLPLVFWDEFDTPLEGASLGWLRRFLMPMQDAAFLDGDVSHPLGPAIFVFAGGTCATFAEFSTGDTPDDRRAKKSDFISRLRGYMDVLGPNPTGPYDVGVKLRRALLLHASCCRPPRSSFARAGSTSTRASLRPSCA